MNVMESTAGWLHLSGAKTFLFTDNPNFYWTVEMTLLGFTSENQEFDTIRCYYDW
jgi:hypothetical protein